MTVSGTTDSSDPDSKTHFVSRTEGRITTQQAELIHPNNIITLPKGQCYALLNGGRPYKLRLPLADRLDFNGMPDKLQAVAKEMHGQYATSDDWYRFTPSWGKAT